MTTERRAVEIDTEIGFAPDSASEDGDDDVDERTPLISSSAEPMTGMASTRSYFAVSTDVLQFSAPVYFADKDEPDIEIEVMRLGKMTGFVSVCFSTQDVTAKNSQEYEAHSGSLMFAPGEHMKTIQVKLIRDGKWTPSTEFKLVLREPKGCALPSHLEEISARVKILNHDVFPTNRYKHQVQNEGKLEPFGDWGLLFSYLAFNFKDAGVKWQTILCLLFDQIGNVCLFITMCFSVYMVDTLFATGTDSSKRLLMSSRYHTALLIASWYVVPTIFLFAWDACKVSFDIQGKSRKFLQTSMMRMYLHYTEESRRKVAPDDLNVAISHSADAVASSYVASINIIQCIGKIMTVMLFICLYQWDHLVIFTVVLMPALLLIIAAMSAGAFQRAGRLCDRELRVLVMLANETCSKFQLLTDYLKRNLMSDIFEKAAKQYTKAKLPVTYLFLCTFYSTRFISGSFIALYIVVKAPAVLDPEHPLSLGLFLATITIYGTYLADSIVELNTHLNVIVQSFTDIQQFTIFFNLPLDLPQFQRVNRLRRHTTSEIRDRQMHRSSSGQLLEHIGKDGIMDLDAIPLQAVDASLEVSGKVVLANLNFSVEQGKSVAVTGPTGAGKRVFMKLLGDEVLPTSGHIFVPSHLRTLYVSPEPMFLRMSLLHNLTLGLPNQHDVDEDRIQSVLELLGMQDMSDLVAEEADRLNEGKTRSPRTRGEQRIREHVGTHHLDVGDAHELADGDHKVIEWLTGMGQSKKMKLHLARAFMANPHVLILARPMMYLQGKADDVVRQLFHEHVSERGLGYDPDTSDERRPRTLFWMAENAEQAHDADLILQVDNQTCLLMNPDGSPPESLESPDGITAVTRRVSQMVSKDDQN